MKIPALRRFAPSIEGSPVSAVSSLTPIGSTQQIGARRVIRIKILRLAFEPRQQLQILRHAPRDYDCYCTIQFDIL